MQFSDLAVRRLDNQHLLQPVADPVEVLRSLGAMQSQDFVGAKWALGMRTKGATDASISKLFDEGKILRTHMLRPTWHFVAADDIRWIQQLTAPRVHAFNKYYYKKLGLDEATLRKGAEVLANALRGGNQLTRDEVKAVYGKAGIDASDLRLAYIIMYAELEAVVCSGAMKGKQHTLALVEERVPHAKTMSPDAALTELTKRFFTAHGPATIQDFAWWSTLTTADIRKGIELAKLASAEIEGTTFYFGHDSKATLSSPVVHLLPNYDELVVAYKERRPLLSMRLEKQPSYVDLSYHFVTLNGTLVGGWKRAVGKNSFTVRLNMFTELNQTEVKALEAVRNQLQDFLEVPVTIERL